LRGKINQPGIAAIYSEHLDKSLSLAKVKCQKKYITRATMSGYQLNYLKKEFPIDTEKCGEK